MLRKILKILISLLFVAVAAVAAVCALKTFTHKSKPESSISVHPVSDASVTTKYGVETLRPVHFDPATTTRYGVIGVMKRLPREQGIEALKSAEDSPKQQETK